MDTFRKIAFVFLAVAALCAAQSMPIGPYGQFPVRTGNVAADTATLTVGQMSGSLLTGTPTAGATYTTPTATAICNLLPFLANSGNNNFAYDYYVKNTSAGANSITMAGGSGVTLVGTGTAAQNFVRHFKLILNCTGTPAVQLLSLETTAF